MVRRYDAVVVGAGPAGLSAAAEITAAGGSCVLLEQGAAHLTRDRHAPEEILSGVGGAGLFSDGKHSFFPSASALWDLPDTTRLRHAYEETRVLLTRHGVPAPAFPGEAQLPAIEVDAGGWREKRYPSLYASLEERMRCIGDLVAQCGERPWLATRVVAARRGPNREIELELEGDGCPHQVRTSNLIIATGRLSPRWIRSWLELLGVTFAFRRLEVGLRIETSSGAPLFTTLAGVDPKLTWDDARARLLTFCTCRDGEVVVGTACNMHAVSGRADGPHTGRSNIGLLARITDRALAREIEGHVFAAPAAFRVALGELLQGGAAHPVLLATFGELGAELMAHALARFIARFPELEHDRAAVVHGPCIEGVGDYPVSSADLGLAEGVMIAGDACGRFRGIVASMISGRYVGRGIARR